MIAALLFALQAPAAPAPAPQATPPQAAAPGSAAPAHAADAPAPPPLEPWPGSFASGLAEIRHRAEVGEQKAAREIGARLVAPNALARWSEAQAARGGWRARLGAAATDVFDALDLLGPPPPVRAEAHHALGTALGEFARGAQDEAQRARLRGEAAQAFERARVLAGPGSLRRDATYDQGCLALLEGEEQRARIPEVSGAPPAPPPQPLSGGAGPGGAGPGADAPPDPLELARAAYLRARERFVERLRLDWRDVDTQKNVELVQRRLHELDEIERKREEQQQQQEDQQKDQQKQDSQPKQDPQQDQKPKPDEQKPDQPEEPKPGEDQEQKPPEPQPEEPKPDEQKPEQEKPESQPQDAQPMSKEEMLQLLERLEKIDDVQKELQERLKRMRRVDVPKDW